MNNIKHKPMTFNRCRAYIRLKLLHKKFNKKTIIVLYVIYFLISLTALLLPENILTLYPILRTFTDFMSFIPAIAIMEQRSFAPELAIFYASYMFIVGIIYFCISGYYIIVYYAKSTKSILEYKKNIIKYKKKAFGFVTVVPCSFIYWLYLFLSGNFVGYIRHANESEYFIDNIFGLIYYINWFQGCMTCIGVPYIMASVIVVIFLWLEMFFKKRINR